MSHSKKKSVLDGSKKFDEYLNLKVRTQQGEQVFFKIKSSTPLKKLMDVYIERQRVNNFYMIASSFTCQIYF